MRKPYIKEKLREGLFDSIDPELFVKAYTNKINSTRDDLLIKLSKAPDYIFLLGVDVDYNPCGEKNKCETNAYAFVKERLKEGKNNFFPVGGYAFDGPTLFPFEHWWVYDKETNKCIEVTPLHENKKPRCYAGLINFSINDKILNSDQVFDLDFFKGGNIYYKYVK